MYGRERRQPGEPEARALREALTTAQLNALETPEHFGWTLRFVRRPMFRSPVPMLFHRDGKRYVVLRADGSLDEAPDLIIRDWRRRATGTLAHAASRGQTARQVA